MTRGQLKDIIKFEAHLKDPDHFDVWIENLIQETLSSITALTRFQELKVPDFQVTLALATQTVTIPAAQHIDFDEMYYLPAGDTQAGFLLFPYKEYMIVNEGRTETIIQKGPTTLSLFPYTEVIASDKLLYDYWAYPTLANDASVIPVEAVVQQLRHECVAEAVLHSDTKQFTIHDALARKKQSRMFASIDLNHN